MAISKFLDPKNDVAFKRIFGSEKNKDILQHFINDVLELKGAQAIQEVTFLSPMQDPRIGLQKQSIVDVLCRTEKGSQIIVEMQVSPEAGFEKRAQYYASKAYARQLKEGHQADGRYVNLKEVIFIAISDYTLFRNKAAYKSDHVIMDKVSYARDLQDFWFTFIELPKFRKKKIEELDGMIEKWCYFFKYAPETAEEDLEKMIGSDQVIKRAYEELQRFNWSEEEFDSYERERKRILDNYNAELAFVEKGRQEGLEEGMKKGIKKGMEKSRQENAEQIARKMLKAGLAVDMIAKMNDLTEAHIVKLQSKG